MITMVCLIGVLVGVPLASSVRGELRVSSFAVDATPELGVPVAYAPTRSIDDPISARGIVLQGAGKPIVLCAVDYIGIGNTGQTVWREALADAVGTSPDRVAVHALHQHDGPRCDFAVEALMVDAGLGGKRFDVAYCRDVINRSAEAAAASMPQSVMVTHLGTGKAKVEKVASNRRVLGDDGKVEFVRYSRTTDPAAIAAPEGLIDPWLRLVSFWNDEQPIVALSYYATHPQSYYGSGDVTCEFVGIARNERDKETSVRHVHFNGAGGNITAGKYNDGSPENRPVLAERMRVAMEQAWAATERAKVDAAHVTWNVEPVLLPHASHLDASKLKATLQDPDAAERDKLMSAKALVWLTRCQNGDPIELSCLTLGRVKLLHLPGELFVEYQLAAQQMQPEHFVAVAAYGDYSPGYIGTEVAYQQGGYEVRQDVTRVAPSVEKVLHKAMRKLLAK